jgi:hypothetical protein
MNATIIVLITEKEEYHHPSSDTHHTCTYKRTEEVAWRMVYNVIGAPMPHLPMSIRYVHWKENLFLRKNIKFLRPPLHIFVGVLIILQEFGNKKRIKKMAGFSNGPWQCTQSLVSFLQHVHVEIDHFVI